MKRVWIIETGIVTIFAVFYFLLIEPTLYLDVNKNVQWLVVVETKDDTSGKIRDNFPKKRTISLDVNGLLLLGENERSMNGPNFLAEHWGGNKSFPLEVIVKGKPSTYVVYSSLFYNLKSSDVKEITKLLNERD